MTREIKFRRWDTDEKYMHYDKPFYLNTDKTRYEIMQFTGLNDKNGKEIYESDILRVPNYKSSGKIVYTTHIVRYSDSHAIFYAQNIDNPEGYGPMGSPLLFLLMEKDCEIIGNIYENPELLTK